VLAAVNFDNQFRFMTGKVGNKAPERHLAAASVTLI
jgi:hypothetical protein